ncbi:MAG: flagellar biosynthetic protein FliR [Oceanococcaceae bacterium]
MNMALILSADSLLHGLWMALRVGGLWMALPVFGSAVLPVRLRLLLTVACALLLELALGARVSMPPPGSPAFWLGALGEIAIGLLLGFVLRMAFEAMLLGAELISLAMGLGFAQLNDPLRGTSAPVLGQVFTVLTTLIFFSLGGHLRLFEWLAWSYTATPGGGQGMLAWTLLEGSLAWSGWMFSHAVQVAAPALFALLIVNIGFGLISRAAPSLNLLAVGFPAALLLGLILLTLMVPILAEQAEEAIAAGVGLIEALIQ